MVLSSEEEILLREGATKWENVFIHSFKYLLNVYHVKTCARHCGDTFKSWESYKEDIEWTQIT